MALTLALASGCGETEAPPAADPASDPVLELPCDEQVMAISDYDGTAVGEPTRAAAEADYVPDGGRAVTDPDDPSASYVLDADDQVIRRITAAQFAEGTWIVTQVTDCSD